MGWPEARAASGGGAWMAPYLVELLDDDYSAIRYAAIRSLRTLPGFDNLAYDYVAPDEARFAATRTARARLSPPPAADRRPELLFEPGGRFTRGDFERLAADRDESDQMFLAE
jgi:hypothetical protein